MWHPLCVRLMRKTRDFIPPVLSQICPFCPVSCACPNKCGPPVWSQCSQTATICDETIGHCKSTLICKTATDWPAIIATATQCMRRCVGYVGFQLENLPFPLFSSSSELKSSLFLLVFAWLRGKKLVFSRLFSLFILAFSCFFLVRSKSSPWF